MFWRRLSICLLCLLAFAIPIEHKYDKLFRFFSLKLIPQNVVLPSFFEKKIYFYPSDIIALGLLFIALFIVRIRLSHFFFSRGAIFLWAVFFFSFISILFSPLAHYPLPYLRLFHLATPFLLYCFLANASSIEEKSRFSELLLKCLVWTALLQSCIAIAQYAIQGPLGLRLLSEPNHFATFTVASGRCWLFDIHWVKEPIRVIRSSGTFPHANVLGGFLSISILAAYSLFFTSKWRRFYALLIPLLFFAMSLTFSRSALFSWMLGTVVWFGLHMRQYGFRPACKNPSIRLLSGCIGFSLLFSFLILHEQISDRGGIVNYNQLAQGSDALRLSYQNIALEILKDHPWHGAGFQQLSIRYLDYVAPGQNYETAGSTHNIYLYLAAETGLFSLAAFLLFILSLLWASIKSPHTPLLTSLIAIYVAFLFIGGCDFYPLLFQQGKIPFFLTAGLLAAHANWKKILVFRRQHDALTR